MWDDAGNRIDLTDPSAKWSAHFSTEVGIGQYGVTPLEHAAGIAEVAARGQAAKAHFIDKVYKNNQPTAVYSGAVGVKQIPGLNAAMTYDMSATLTKVVDHYNVEISGRDLAGKSGTWQLHDGPENAHAWFVGYSGYNPEKKANGLAAAVWLGNKKGLAPLEFANGRSIIGGTGPGQLWQYFMKNALGNSAKVKFNAAVGTGSIKVGNGKMPVQQDPTPPGDGQGNDGPGNGGPGNGTLPGNTTTGVPNPFPSRKYN
jgi:membrane peptidoglycan carboxypeptidase